jgi:GR25 family glycosyltransferase involved in LPS biosynthesis
MKIINYIYTNIEIIIFFLLVSIVAYLILRHSWEGFFTLQHGINRLDAIIYINLENRVDRKDLLMKELEKLNTDMSKVHKVSGVYMPKNGHKGCVQSHILALNMIKMNDWNRVLILEDDAELDMDPTIINTIINKSLEELDKQQPDWNVLMLATANKVLDDSHNTNTTIKTIPIEINLIDIPKEGSPPSPSSSSPSSQPSSSVSLKIQKLKTATTASAYIVNKSYVDTILNLFNHCNTNMSPEKLNGNDFEIWALDQKWFDIQMKDKWYCFDTDIIKQRAIWSTTQSNVGKYATHA